MITVIIGTNRVGNQSAVVAEKCLAQLQALQQEAQLFTLEDLPHDFIFSASYGRHHADFEVLVNKYIVAADKLVFILPEYNGSIPGVLKSFLDCIRPDIMAGKKAALIGLSAGRTGNLRGLDHFMGILHYLQVEVLSSKPKLSVFKSLLHEGQLNDQSSIDLLNNCMKKLINF